MKRYFVNEIFATIQGEGVRVGTVNVFVRLGKCNLACREETHGFDCDTEFESGRWLNVEDLCAEVEKADEHLCRAVVLTGGEPTLQADDLLVSWLHRRGYFVAIETNGSRRVEETIDWVTVSPKVAEHAIRQRTASEVKYVRAHGQGVPKTVITADHYLISPRFRGDDVDLDALAWCIQLVQENPPWRLSCQAHKFWGIR